MPRALPYPAADPPPLEIHSRLAAQGSQIHSNNPGRRTPNTILIEIHSIFMLLVDTIEGCTAGDWTEAYSTGRHHHITLQESRSPQHNICPEDVLVSIKCSDTSLSFRLAIVHTMPPTVLLYHSISKSCCIGTSVVTA